MSFREINYSEDPGRVFLEQEYLPNLEGTVLFIGVNYYNDFYHLLVKEPKKYETLDILEERRQFGSPYKHYTSDILDFKSSVKYDNVCCFGMLGHADDWEKIKNEEDIKECITVLDNLVKPTGTLLLGPCCSQTEFDIEFWDKIYNNLVENKYKIKKKERIGINYILWIKKTYKDFQPIILTTPHSGTHLLCYYIGFLSQRHLLLNDGSERKMSILNAVDYRKDIIHSHDPNSILDTLLDKNNKKLIVLIRDPIDYIMRNINYTRSAKEKYGGNLPSYSKNDINNKNINNLKEYLKYISKCENFILPTNDFLIEDFSKLYKNNINVDNYSECINYQYLLLQFYDNWKYDKKLIFYEDLINNPKTILSEIELFFEEKWNIDNFIKNLNNHSKYVHNYYTSYDKNCRKCKLKYSVESGNYSSMLNDEDKSEIKKLYRNICPEIYDKYLNNFL